MGDDHHLPPDQPDAPQAAAPEPEASPEKASGPVTDWTYVDRMTYLSGLKDIEGTFSGLMSNEGMQLLYPDGKAQVYMYGPKQYAHWWQRWFRRFMERYFDEPYPTELYCTGIMESLEQDAEDGTVTFRFTSKGTLEMKD